MWWEEFAIEKTAGCDQIMTPHTGDCGKSRSREGLVISSTWRRMAPRGGHERASGFL